MISSDDILSLGFTKVDEWSTDVTDSYIYRVNRYDKPRNTINQYMLDRLIDTNYMELKSTLQRETDFNMALMSFNGEMTTIEDLFDLFEMFRENARKV